MAQTGSSAVDPHCGRLDSRGGCDLYQISMIQLIANPNQFHGKKVMIAGFLRLEFEGNGIYIHKEDYRNGIAKNGLWVETQGRKLTSNIQPCRSGQYALIEGTFNSQHTGHMGLWSGAIESITSCMVWPPRPKR